MHAAVLIGRFQPPHRAHLALIRAARARHGRVLLLLGSANLARSVKNPFSAPERAGLIRRALEGGTRALRFRSLADRFDAARWATDVRAAVAAAGVHEPVLFGVEKDASSSYLRWFPDWPLDLGPGEHGLNATDLRAALWRQDWAAAAPQLHPTTLAWLQAFSRTRAFGGLVREAAAVQAERARFAPGHVWHERLGLHSGAGTVSLVRRTGPIGHGLWSLPPVEAAAGPPLGVFDHPARSLLGPSEARVFAVDGPPSGAVPYGLGVIRARPRGFFEDHAVILARLLGQM